MHYICAHPKGCLNRGASFHDIHGPTRPSLSPKQHFSSRARADTPGKRCPKGKASGGVDLGERNDDMRRARVRMGARISAARMRDLDRCHDLGGMAMISMRREGLFPEGGAGAGRGLAVLHWRAGAGMEGGRLGGLCSRRTGGHEPRHRPGGGYNRPARRRVSDCDRVIQYTFS